MGVVSVVGPLVDIPPSLPVGICNEDISRGASVSEGLGDCTDTNSPPLLVLTSAEDDGDKEDPEEDTDETAADGGMSCDTTLANSSAKLDVLASIAS